MKKIFNMILAILVMGAASIVGLWVVSLFSYWLKWQADKALIGIILTYIFAGFMGGICMKWYPKWKQRKKEEVVQEQKTAGIMQKIKEAVILGTVFLLLLFVLSLVVNGTDFSLSWQAAVIWLLLVGSAGLGRI